jgi:hypothetical protein
VVQTLLESGANVAAKTHDGRTALDYTVRCDDEVRKDKR